eukprot:16448289-Heterocapsa_arctica.AAC.1
MTPWSKRLYSCHVCKTNYNRQSERASKDPQLKEWWKAMDKDAKANWFRENKRTYEPNKKHAFDHAG